MEKIQRVLVLIDGFNYYHKLKKYQTNNNVCVKWLDYMSMVEQSFKDYRRYDKYQLEVIYFSAIAQFRGEEPVKRHKTYINALKQSGINIVLGEFKEKLIDPCFECTQKCRMKKSQDTKKNILM